MSQGPDDQGSTSARPGDEPGTSRLPYLAPQMTRVSLAGDEVLAKGCKLTGGGPSFQGPGCLPGGCFATGS
ncbi:MAG: hypothetical protein H6983_14200 [Ectothiorhodospiraceae bacterium]|nr:hypothetical protein [Chromatiales bacterium]MCP5155317.1 hypothetical protein [Ectothiorhodospiraceae bacterium]